MARYCYEKQNTDYRIYGFALLSPVAFAGA